jgi:hypothetical protein
VFSKTTREIYPSPGDLVAVNSANEYINSYVDSFDFSFANVAFTARNGELGIVLSNCSEEGGSILYHYVRVLFQRGLVGIVHGGLVKIVQDQDETTAIKNKSIVDRLSGLTLTERK